MLGRTGQRVSVIGLGTAEIGSAYGIGPRVLPSDKEAEYILKTAVDLGVTYFDTARFYNLAEERIGRSGIAKKDGVIIGTKCAQFLEKDKILQCQEKEKRILEEVDASLKNLNLDALPLLQLHGGTRKDIEEGALIEILQKLKAAGKIRFTGISPRNADDALAAVESGFFDTIQIAHSIVDQRMASAVLPLALGNFGGGAIDRSVLLKGALTPLRAHLPGHLALLRQNAQKAADIASELEIDLPSLAVRFVLSNEAVAVALVGTSKPQNLVKIIKAAAEGPLPPDVLVKLRKLAIDDPNQVETMLWFGGSSFNKIRRFFYFKFPKPDA